MPAHQTYRAAYLAAAVLWVIWLHALRTCCSMPLRRQLASSPWRPSCKGGLGLDTVLSLATERSACSKACHEPQS